MGYIHTRRCLDNKRHRLLAYVTTYDSSKNNVPVRDARQGMLLLRDSVYMKVLEKVKTSDRKQTSGGCGLNALCLPTELFVRKIIILISGQ